MFLSLSFSLPSPFSRTKQKTPKCPYVEMELLGHLNLLEAAKPNHFPDIFHRL